MAKTKRSPRLPGNRRSNKKNPPGYEPELKSVEGVDLRKDHSGEDVSNQNFQPDTAPAEPNEHLWVSECGTADNTYTQNLHPAPAAQPEYKDKTAGKPQRKSRKKPEAHPEEVSLTVGQLIGFKRREKHWSQMDLALISGISRSEIGRIERDECDPRIENIEALEAVLEIPLYDRFMEQKRQRRKRSREEKQGDGRMMSEFNKELVRMGIKGAVLKDVLDGALRVAGDKVESPVFSSENDTEDHSDKTDALGDSE